MGVGEQLPVLDFGFDQIKTQYCIDLDTRDRQVTENCARIPGRLAPHADRYDEIAIVAFGPSLEQTWEQVKAFKYIITCSGAHKYLLERGIVPTWHAEVDPRPHKAQLIGAPHKDVEYLVASVVHRKVIDLLEGHNVKLWHVYANEASRDKAVYAYPRGEWALTGGTNVGIRCLSLARFMGFRRMTLFGLDYSFKPTGEQHADWHPKEFPNIHAVQVAGEVFYTNAAMHQYAQQFFHEVQQLGDIELAVEGHGLLQAQIAERMAAGIPITAEKGRISVIAATTPETISHAYADLNRQLHEENPDYGVSGSKRADTVKKIITSLTNGEGPPSVLDYGCGKGTLAKALPTPIWEYDPAIPGKDQPPRPADLVVCTDVLEHVEPEYLGATLLDLRRVTQKVCYVVVHTGAAMKTLPDGRNTHLIQQPREWWEKQLSKHFAIAQSWDAPPEVAFMLGPKVKEKKAADVPAAPAPEANPEATAAKESAPTVPGPDTSETTIKHDGTEARFKTPNKQTRWRAMTLLKKEPATIEWIDTFRPGAVFYDIGANVGGYTVWASRRRGAKVYAFEPEALNYALLNRNMALNSVAGRAYCVALSDAEAISSLHLSSVDEGGSCHTFRESVGPDLKMRRPGPEQGCLGVTLDAFVERGNLPAPDHIKLDVDGLEHKVIMGAEKTLRSGHVKSLLVEVNQNLTEHMEMVEALGAMGFVFDQAQVEASVRKDGQFKGCAEYVFSFLTEIEKHILAAIDGAKIESKPYQHLCIDGIFPPAIYQQILAELPEQREYKSLEEVRGVAGYPERYCGPMDKGVFHELERALRAGPIRKRLCAKLGIVNDGLTDETLLIRDLPGYAIGPHTDSPRKVLSALFYLPKDDSQLNAGTSLYVPRINGFRCPGGPHYNAEGFKRVKTAPFAPNSVFIFAKSEISFHGVGRYRGPGVRDVLLYDVRRLA